MANQQPERALRRNPTLLAILVFGIVLRLWNLGRQSLWIDEGFSWLAIRLSFRGITALSWSDVHPPLYYYILKASQYVLPSSEFGLRLPSVLFSVITLAVMVAFVNRRWGHRAACYVGLLGAVSPFDIYYAQETRMYALLAFLFVLSFTQLADALQGRPACLIGWVAASMGLAWTHVYGLITVFVQIWFLFSYWAWHSPRRHPLAFKPRQLIVALSALFLGILPIVVLIWQIRGNKPGSGLMADAGHLRSLVRCWAVGPMNSFPAFHISWRIRDLSVAVMVGCALWGARQLWKRGESYNWVVTFAAVLILLPPLLIYGLSTLKHEAVWVDKGFLGCAHIFYLLAGVGLGAIGLRTLRVLVVAAIAVTIVSGEMYYRTKFEKSEAATAFHSLPPATPQRAILVIPYWRNCEADYYLGSGTTIWTVQEHHPQQLERIPLPTAKMPDELRAGCDDPEFQSASDVYAFGDVSIIRNQRTQWPTCLRAKKIWIFEDARWRPIDG
jgi:4-amino-4-deoxy-L-arabinose transferase-like glycosyltransferase